MEWFRRAQVATSVTDKFGRRIVSAPAGPLGILVTASSHGTPQIGSVEPGSALRDAVECGDLLLCVGAHDVSRLPYDRAANLLNSLAARPRRLVLLPIGAVTPSAPALFETTRAAHFALKKDEPAAPPLVAAPTTPVCDDGAGSCAPLTADTPKDSTAAAALALWAVSEGELARDAAAKAAIQAVPDAPALASRAFANARLASAGASGTAWMAAFAAASRASSPSETAHSASAAAAVLSLGVSAVRGAHEPAPSSQTGVVGAATSGGAAGSSFLSAKWAARVVSKRAGADGVTAPIGRSTSRRGRAASEFSRLAARSYGRRLTSCAPTQRSKSPHSTASRRAEPGSTEPICGVPCDDAVTRIPSGPAGALTMRRPNLSVTEVAT